MVVALLLYAYARGVRSSRAIERACEEDVAYRVIAARQRPDHATIARFVERHEEALAGLFGAVLGLCARAGLARVGVIAIDGTKLLANASRDENLDYERPRALLNTTLPLTSFRLDPALSEIPASVLWSAVFRDTSESVTLARRIPSYVLPLTGCPA
jgi:hypothetical protein